MAIDYDKIAHAYDRHRRGGGPYLDKLVALATAASANRVLEIGPGTANNTQAFREAYACNILGLDRSSEMLRSRVFPSTLVWPDSPLNARN